MTDFLKKRFSVSAPISDAYAENYERTFGHKGPKHDPEPDVLGGFNQAQVDRQMQALAHIRHAQSQPLPPLASRPVASIALSELEKWRDDLQSFVSRREFDTLNEKYELSVRRTLEAIKLVIHASAPVPTNEGRNNEQ